MAKIQISRSQEPIRLFKSDSLEFFTHIHMLHYAMHHAPMRSRALKYVHRYHMLHHTHAPDLRYGVSSPLWDVVFGTKPAE